MILETTNPKYKTCPQIPADRKFYTTTPERSDLEFFSACSLAKSRGNVQTEHFAERKPHGGTVPNREPEPKSRGPSLQIFDGAHDALRWFIIDVVAGAVFARVCGSHTSIGRRHRRMQLAIEFTICAIVVGTIDIACAVAL